MAVLLEAARAPELAPLIADAYRLTERERLVTELVARGYPTTEIAARLHLSAYTVQDHLKAIFDKSGTGSRGELVARLFVDQLGTDSGGSADLRPVDLLDRERHQDPAVGDHHRPVLVPVRVLAGGGAVVVDQRLRPRRRPGRCPAR